MCVLLGDQPHCVCKSNFSPKVLRNGNYEDAETMFFDENAADVLCFNMSKKPCQPDTCDVAENKGRVRKLISCRHMN